MTETCRPSPELITTLPSGAQDARMGQWTETLAFLRLKIQAGEISVDEALRISEAGYRNVMKTLAAGFPVEEDSFELPGEWPPKPKQI